MSRDAPEQRDNHAQQYRAITSYIAKHQPCGFADLFDVFGEGTGNYDDRKALHKRLQTLLDRGVLSKQVDNRKASWRLCPEEPVLVDATPPVSASLVHARQGSCMHRAVYQPSPCPPQRPGADQFLQVRSHGVRC